MKLRFSDLLKSIFFNKPYFLKMFLSTFLVSLVPSVLMFIILYNTFTDTIIKEIGNTDLNSLGQIEIYMDSMVRELINTNIDYGLYTNLSKFSVTRFEEDIVGFNRLQNHFSALKLRNSSVDYTFAYFWRFEYYVGIIPYVNANTFAYRKNMDVELVDNLQNSNMLLSSVTYGQDEEHVISTRAILSPDNRVSGILVSGVSCQTIIDKITSMKAGSHSTAVVHSRPLGIYINTDTTDPLDRDIVVSLTKNLRENEYGIVELPEGRYLVCYMISDLYELDYILYTPLNRYLSQVDLASKISLYVLTVVALICFVLIYLTSRNNYSPIHSVVMLVKSFLPGKADPLREDIASVKAAIQNMHNTNTRLSRIVESNKYIIRYRGLNKILNGETENESFLENSDGFIATAFNERFFCVMLIKSAVNRYTAPQRNGIPDIFYILSISESILQKSQFSGEVLQTFDEEAAIIFNFTKSVCNDATEEIQSYSELVRDAVRQYCAYEVTIGIGAIHEEISGISASYKEAKRALDYGLLTGTGIVVISDELENRSSLVIRTEQFKGDITRFFCTGNLRDIDDTLDHIEHLLKGNIGGSIDEVVNIYLGIISFTLDIVSKRNVYLYDDRLFANAYSEFMKNTSIGEMTGWLKHFFRETSDRLNRHAEANRRADQNIGLARQYILSSFTRDLSLNEVAEYIGLHPVYFSNLFKERCGVTFLDFVNTRRIEMAKKLLGETNKKITEVAFSVGYSNVQSFSRYFKKYEGVTPNAYRLMIMPERQEKKYVER